MSPVVPIQPSTDPKDLQRCDIFQYHQVNQIADSAVIRMEIAVSDVPLTSSTFVSAGAPAVIKVRAGVVSLLTRKATTYFFNEFLSAEVKATGVACYFAINLKPPLSFDDVGLEVTAETNLDGSFPLLPLHSRNSKGFAEATLTPSAGIAGIYDITVISHLSDKSLCTRSTVVASPNSFQSEPSSQVLSHRAEALLVQPLSTIAHSLGNSLQLLQQIFPERRP